MTIEKKFFVYTYNAANEFERVHNLENQINSATTLDEAWNKLSEANPQAIHEFGETIYFIVPGVSVKPIEQTPLGMSTFM